MARLAEGRQITQRIVTAIHQRPLVVDFEGDGAGADHALVIVAPGELFTTQPPVDGHGGFRALKQDGGRRP